MKPPLKDGIKTTEFWLTTIAVIISAALTILEQLSAGWAITAVTALTALYNVIRFAQKQGAQPK